MTEANLKRLYEHFTKEGNKKALEDLEQKYPNLFNPKKDNKK